MPPEPAVRPSRLVRPTDFVWLFLFGVLTLTSQVGDAFEIVPLALLALIQVLEPRIPGLAAFRGRMVWIALKLVTGYILIGYTGGIQSRYWPVLLLPVVSAATAFGLAGTLSVALATGAAYASFLAWVDWREGLVILVVRFVFLAMVGNLVNALAEDLRVQSRNYRRAAEQLAEANRHVQEAEEAVRRSDRLAALGQLSAGLAHELRNPLGTIRASSEMLNRTLSAENDVAREVAGFITSEADRMNSLVTRFLQFARPLQLRLEPSDLGAMIDRAIAAASREAQSVSIYKNYDPGIAPFPFDAEMMERVVFNLVVNAAQATAPGGAVTVKTRASGGVAEIAVIDRGSGIEPGHLDSIFNPFFTTKPQGVGLGLAIVSKIVDEHGGKIAVESEAGRGSVFRVLLPLTPLAVREAQE